MLALARMPVICMLGFYAYLQVSIATYVTSPQRISGDGNLFSPTANITLTVYGVTLKTGSDRLTDSLGRVNFHGGIDGSFPLAVTVGAEGNQPGISGFDYVRRVLYYTGSSSFGGAVLSANVSNSPVVLPPDQLPSQMRHEPRLRPRHWLARDRGPERIFESQLTYLGSSYLRFHVPQTPRSARAAGIQCLRSILSARKCLHLACASARQKDRELASKYYHSTHVSVSPRITQVAVTQ